MHSIAMHIYFSGIGGTGVGPLALVAQQAGYTVSGSDKQDSAYIEYLKKHGISDVHIGQGYDEMQAVHNNNPIDWFVYTSALPLENPDAPELRFCAENNIKISKRDELLNKIIDDKNLKMIAIAGTHGKTTTTAMTIWAMTQLNIPISYILPAKSSFAEMGEFNEKSEYFVYECDEFDRNFLNFNPFVSLISGIDYDHPDIYPTIEEYNQAFIEFIGQSQQTIMWHSDATKINQQPSPEITILENELSGDAGLTLAGQVNRENAYLVAKTLEKITKISFEELVPVLNVFPGVSRRFERIIPNLYSDYAHTPPKIKGALRLGHEVAGDNLIVVYEGLHNTRQHFIKDELADLFNGVKQLYIVPSYLAREDESLKLLSPVDLKALLNDSSQKVTVPSGLNGELLQNIKQHLEKNDTVLCLTAGGGGSLDEWLRKSFLVA